MPKYHIILLSNSLRRHLLIRNFIELLPNFSLEIQKKNITEDYPNNINVEEIPEYLAYIKAKSYTEKLSENDIVITADTLVILEDQILGKPKNKNKAVAMLKYLSDKTHQVITGVCILTKNSYKVFHDITLVTFKLLEENEILNYVDKYHPYDKAGGYGVQEWLGMIAIKHIEGSYYNVMGLPLHRLYEELKKNNYFA